MDLEELAWIFGMTLEEVENELLKMEESKNGKTIK